MSVEKYERWFREADADGNGQLTLDELVTMLKKGGHREREARGFFLSVDTSGDGLISKQEFLEAMGVVPPEQKTGAAMRMVFRQFDRDNNGKIEKSELGEMFKEMGKHFTDAELKRMIELMDKDKNNSVDYEEFIEYFTKK